MKEQERQTGIPGKKEKPRYFEEALADFTHDVACGGAVRHLVDLGYSTDQILRELSFPTARPRVEQMIYRRMTETGILLETLPVSEEKLEVLCMKKQSTAKICVFLRKRIEENGEENSYVLCPFGTWRRDREKRLQEALACLTGREREYILGLPLPMKPVYHRLNDRMAEIAIQLASSSDMELKFYFIKSGQMLKFNQTAKQ